MNLKSKWVGIILVGLSVTSGLLITVKLYIDDLLESPREPREFSEWHNYKIDPATIFEKLEQGDVDIFTPILATPEDYKMVYSNPFPWKQADYLKIADALHHYVWNEDVKEWQLYKMSFYGKCRYNPIQFDLVKFIYIKSTDSQSYIAHGIDVYPLYEGVGSAEEGNLQKPLFGLEGVNLDKLKVTADDALRMAEENGGTDARLAIDNQCDISISSSEHNWYVRYSIQASTNSTVFEMIINSYTGKYKFP